MNEWISVKTRLPPRDVYVETKVDDFRGPRNVQEMRLAPNGLWFIRDGMYVYYQPTHWREKKGN